MFSTSIDLCISKFLSISKSSNQSRSTATCTSLSIGMYSSCQNLLIWSKPTSNRVLSPWGLTVTTTLNTITIAHIGLVTSLPHFLTLSRSSKFSQLPNCLTWSPWVISICPLSKVTRSGVLKVSKPRLSVLKFQFPAIIMVIMRCGNFTLFFRASSPCTPRGPHDRKIQSACTRTKWAWNSQRDHCQGETYFGQTQNLSYRKGISV